MSVESVRAQFKLTEGHVVSNKALKQLARKTLKEYSSSYDFNTFKEDLGKLFHYLANTEQPV